MFINEMCQTKYLLILIIFCIIYEFGEHFILDGIRKNSWKSSSNLIECITYLANNVSDLIILILIYLCKLMPDLFIQTQIYQINFFFLIFSYHFYLSFSTLIAKIAKMSIFLFYRKSEKIHVVRWDSYE